MSESAKDSNIVLGKVSLTPLLKVKTQLEESNLPFKVDIVNYNQCSNEFQKIIDKDLKAITDLPT